MIPSTKKKTTWFICNIMLLLFSCNLSSPETGNNDLTERKKIVHDTIIERPLLYISRSDSSDWIFLKFADSMNGLLWNKAHLLLTASNGSEMDLLTRANDPADYYELNELCCTRLMKDSIADKYYTSRKDSILVILYKKGVGLSKGFFIPIAADTVIKSVTVEVSEN